MKKTAGFIGAAMLLASSAAFAQPPQQRGTMTQAIESNLENQAKNPGNRGLTNAFVHITENAARHEAHHQTRAERVERPERIERVDFAARAEIARIHRPDRPQRNGRR